MNKSLTILIVFIHDFASGFWAATVFIVYWLHRLHLSNPELASALRPLGIEFFYFGLASVAVGAAYGYGQDIYPHRKLLREGCEENEKKDAGSQTYPAFRIFRSGNYWQYN